MRFRIPGQKKHMNCYVRRFCPKRKWRLRKRLWEPNEKLLVLYPTREGIIVKTLFYYDEIAAMPKTVPKMKLDENELNMAKMLIENMTKPFVAEEYQDEYQARLREAIMKKIQGQDIVAVDTAASSNVIDLMEALKRALNCQKKRISAARNG